MSQLTYRGSDKQPTNKVVNVPLCRYIWPYCFWRQDQTAGAVVSKVGGKAFLVVVKSFHTPCRKPKPSSTQGGSIAAILWSTWAILGRKKKEHQHVV